MEVWIDGILIPPEQIESVKHAKSGAIVVVTVDHEKKQRVQTDSTIRKIELK
jgi:hypothetical protein